MNPQDQLMELLEKYNFDLVRQRKHRIFRNPDGLTFVTASTPSDRKAPQNALSTLKRILRQAGAVDESPGAVDSEPIAKGSPVVQPALTSESSPMIEPAPAIISDQEWEAWKRQYWQEEKLRAKNERFLSMFSGCVDCANELMRKRGNLALDIFVATDAVKSKMRDLHYKSKVLLYNLTIFDQGIVREQQADMPVLWASNGHTGISALVFCNVYVQHEPLRLTKLRFDLDGFPVVCELPDKDERKFLVVTGSRIQRHRAPSGVKVFLVSKTTPAKSEDR
jgi:predicted RNA binding protein YcfA (HicA-like mRNA interferase family)